MANHITFADHSRTHLPIVLEESLPLLMYLDGHPHCVCGPQQNAIA